MAQAAPKPRVVTAEKFVLKSAQGQDVAELSVIGRADVLQGLATALVLKDPNTPNGGRTTTLSNSGLSMNTDHERFATGLSSSGLVLLDNFLPVAHFHLDAAGKPALELLRDPMTPRLRMRLLPDGAPDVEMLDDHGKTRARLGLGPAGSPGLALLDATGKPLLAVAAESDGALTLRLLGRDGKVRFVAPPHR